MNESMGVSRSDERADEAQASPRERFDLLYDRLRHIHDTFLDAVFKATAAFLIVTGWTVTSDVARQHLRSDPLVRWLVVAALLVYALLYAAVAFRTARNSRSVSDQLRALAYMPAEHYRDVEVSPRVTIGFAIANFLLVIAVAVFIVRIAG